MARAFSRAIYNRNRTTSNKVIDDSLLDFREKTHIYFYIYKKKSSLIPMTASISSLSDVKMQGLSNELYMIKIASRGAKIRRFFGGPP